MKIKSDYLIYCDESCPLEHDGNDIMVIGAISCAYEDKEKIFYDLRELKKRHNMNSRTETKWIKVSESKLEYYKELVDYFVENNIRIRILIAKEKKKLDHDKYNNGSYNKWYFKMYYQLLNKFVDSNYSYYMMFDQKDKYTKNSFNEVKSILEKIAIQHALDENEFAFNIKQINSKESELIQMLDIFLGAAAYKNRNLYFYNNSKKNKMNGKDKVIKYIEDKTEKQLNETTPPHEPKLNIFLWEARHE